MAEAEETVEADELGPETGPVRLCAVSRLQKSPEAMLRFVVDPHGQIVPDLKRRLPGRGVWVDATHATLAEAVRRNVFAKSLKRNVTVPADLPDAVERLFVRRACEALSLANKAGSVVAGFSKVDEMIGAGRALLLMHASDGSADGIGKLDARFRASWGDAAVHGEICKELTSEEMSLALGRMNVVHAAASEGGATRQLMNAAGRLRRFRTSTD